MFFFIDTLDTLTEWTLEGLNLEKAIGQPDAAYKVRHLKMGIRVAGSLCSCDEAVTTNVLVCKSILIALNEKMYLCIDFFNK